MQRRWPCCGRRSRRRCSRACCSCRAAPPRCRHRRREVRGRVRRDAQELRDARRHRSARAARVDGVGRRPAGRACRAGRRTARREVRVHREAEEPAVVVVVHARLLMSMNGLEDVAPCVHAHLAALQRDQHPAVRAGTRRRSGTGGRRRRARPQTPVAFLAAEPPPAARPQRRVCSRAACSRAQRSASNGHDEPRFPPRHIGPRIKPHPKGRHHRPNGERQWSRWARKGSASDGQDKLTKVAVPHVSVGLPVRNGERFLARALDSLLAQDHADLEIVVSDNASDDATPDICRQYARQDSRVRYQRNESNIGLVANFNRAFELRARSALQVGHPRRLAGAGLRRPLRGRARG